MVPHTKVSIFLVIGFLVSYLSAHSITASVKTLADGSEYVDKEAKNAISRSEEENSSDDKGADYSLGGQRIRGGDMLYPWEVPGGASTRQAINPSANGDPNCRRWPNGVLLYNRESSLTTAAWNQLVAAMNAWSTLTCVRFQPINGNTNQPYVKYLDAGAGRCYAHVGRICWINGRNELSLGAGCYSSIGTPAHELGHSLGVFHQHSRTDRDSYVTINTANVDSRFLSEFEKKLDTNNFGVQYDYCSVLHYFNRAFSVNGGITITTTQSAYQNLIGQRSGLSFGDIQLVNAMYNCAAHCSSTLTCPSRCFLNKNCKCYCPDLTPGCNYYHSQKSPSTIEPNGGPPPPTTCVKTVNIRWYASIRFTTNNSPETCTYILRNSGRYRQYRHMYIYLYYIRILPQQSPCRSYVAINLSGSTSFSPASQVCSTFTTRRGRSSGNSISMQISRDGSRQNYYVIGYAIVTR